MAKTTVPPRTVAAIQHDEATRKNIPTAEFQPVVEKAQESPVRVAYERRNRDLDPQLVWRGKDALDAANLVVHAPPLYIQEKVHPKALVDDLVRGSRERAAGEPGSIPDLFADFNGLPKGVDKTEFYQHEQNWTNRLILGDSLQVMASLAEREGLRGKVQCIYFDPPYGIKFNSNFQWSTTSRDVKDGNLAHITREPEQVKAFRDTWRDGIHSYLTYLRDRLIAARELLTESGSIFVQIGDENVHKIRAVMDEVFGENNFEGQVFVQKTGGLGTSGLKSVADYLLWYSKQHETVKCRKLFRVKLVGEGQGTGARYDQVQSPDGMRRALTSEERQDPSLIPRECRCYQLDNLTSGAFRENTTVNFEFRGSVFHPGNNACWKTTVEG